MTIRPALLLLLPATVLVLAGCSAPAASGGDTGSSGGDSAASAPADDGTDDGSGFAVAAVPDHVCDLLSLDEASQAWGEEISTTDETTGACVFSGPSTGFSLTFSSLGGSDGWDLTKQIAGDAADVAGAGDRALCGDSNALSAQQGDTIIGVQAALTDDPGCTRAASVAKAVFAKL